jgi:replicative DNA helicase
MSEPWSESAEQAVLGSMLIDQAAAELCLGRLTPEDFYREAHRRIFAAVKAVGQADVVLVGEELQRRGGLEAVGGLTYLADLAGCVPATAMAEHYAGVVGQKAMLRRLAMAGKQIAAGADEYDDAAEALAAAEELLARVKSASAIAQPVHMGTVIERRWAEHRNRSTRTEGWPTGFRDLDAILGGLRNGELIVLGARPSAGKTAFALALAQRRAETANVLFVSLETGRTIMADREIAAATGLSAKKLRAKVYGDERLDAAEEHVGRLMALPVYALDEGDLTTDRVLAAAWSLSASQGGLGLVVVDYLTLLTDRRARGESEATHVGHMAHKLQRLAINLGCPVLLISQLSREVEHRDDKRPVLADLRDSGVIEQAASVVVFLYRPGYYGEPPDGMVEAIVAKQKDGPIGTARLSFDLETGRFGDWVENGPPAPAPRQGRPRRRFGAAD